MTSREDTGGAPPEAVASRADREGKRRRIPWDELDAAALDETARLKVGATWRSRRKQEHLAVGAFALLTAELAAEGCDPVVLGLVSRAVSDEARHGEICRRVAVHLLGETAVPARVRGVPKVPCYPGALPEARTLFHVVEMCCLNETFTGVYLGEMLARTRNPGMRGAIEALLEDEIDHGRVGWAYLASRRREGSLAGLADALPAMLDRTMGWVMRKPITHPEPDAPSLEVFGYLGNDAGAAIFGRTLRDVILPGFETLGVDLGPAQQRIHQQGWLPSR